MDYEIPIFGVCGASDTGKTSFICDLIEELTGRGYDIATIKHTRGEFSLDDEGKDTWRHSKAGAELVVFSTQKETDILIKDTLDLDEILTLIEDIDDYDAVLIEGMREADFPKLNLNADENEMITDVKTIADRIEKNIDINEILEDLPKTDCKRCGYERCADLASAIWNDEESLDSCESLKKGEMKRVELSVDGNSIPLGNFPAQVIERTIKGMLSSLKDVDEMKEIKEIELNISEER